MKVGIISDIHGNLPALEVVFKAGKKNNIEQWVFLGDLVGYYYWPYECIQLLDEHSVSCISGNHDRMLCDIYNGNNDLLKKITLKYGVAINQALKSLPDEQLKWLCSLPSKKELSIDGYNVLLCHGSPWNMDFYVYPDANASIRNRMIETGHDLILFGHTHYPVVWRESGKFIVNPGSVGQPRDFKPGASWAIWDTTDNKIIQKREYYDYNHVIKACCQYDPGNLYLQNVLTRRK